MMHVDQTDDDLDCQWFTNNWMGLKGRWWLQYLYSDDDDDSQVNEFGRMMTITISLRDDDNESLLMIPRWMGLAGQTWGWPLPCTCSHIRSSSSSSSPLYHHYDYMYTLYHHHNHCHPFHQVLDCEDEDQAPARSPRWSREIQKSVCPNSFEKCCRTSMIGSTWTTVDRFRGEYFSILHGRALREGSLKKEEEEYLGAWVHSDMW